MSLKSSISKHGLTAAVLLMAMLSGCERWPTIAKDEARQGLERCMAHTPLRIQWVYVGRDTVCGVVGAVGFRGLSGGPSPFVFHTAPLAIRQSWAGPDYEDYLLNRLPVTSAAQADNLASLARNCRLPKDWELRCAASVRAGSSDIPAYCPIVKLRNLMVLEVGRDGCPGGGA